MDDHHLNYIKKLERKKKKHWSKGIPPFPYPSPPKLKNICHISFFQYFSFFNPCFNFMNCDAKKKLNSQNYFEKEKEKIQNFHKKFAQNKIALNNQFIT